MEVPPDESRVVCMSCAHQFKSRLGIGGIKPLLPVKREHADADGVVTLGECQ